MGMTDQQIQSVRGFCNSIDGKITSVRTSCEGLTNILQHNGDYYYFKIGTDRGDATDSKLNDTIKLISNDLCGAFSSELVAIRELCDQQEELNRIKRLQELKRKQEEEAREKEMNGGM